MTTIFTVAQVSKKMNPKYAKSLNLFYALGSVGASAEAQGRTKNIVEVEREIVLGAREATAAIDKLKNINV